MRKQNKNQTLINSSESEINQKLVEVSIQKPKKKLLHYIKVALLSLLALALILSLSAYLIIRGYINKMNLVTVTDNSNELVTELQQDDEVVTQDDSELADEEADSDVPDSPQDEIDSLEEATRNNMLDNSTPIRSDKNVINILLIGSDTRKSGRSGRSDAMILVSINKDTKKLIATSILRDIYLQIPGRSSNRLNAAYAYGGADLLMETIEQNFKIKIDRYASIDFYAFMDVVDAVGGVTIDVTSEEVTVMNYYIRELNHLTNQESDKDKLTSAGALLLNGKQALSYARIRYVGHADFERTARQRRVLKQIYGHVKKLGLLELNDLMNIVLPQVTTNLTEGELLSMLLSLPTYSGYDIEQWSVPVEGSYTPLSIRGMSVLGIDFDKNMDEMNDRIYGDLKD